jgi:1,4-alpha-glucan branching enzyme
MLLDLHHLARTDRYSANRTTHQVNFSYFAPNATRVSLAGDLNQWDSTTTPMKRMPDGGWVMSLSLHHGHHQYYFLVDGCRTLDPRSSGTVRNERGEPTSLIAVS